MSSDPDCFSYSMRILRPSLVSEHMTRGLVGVEKLKPDRLFHNKQFLLDD
jgi:hypothetical protein